jgi:DNA polymerase
VRLAAPERLIVFGANVLPLLGHELPQAPAVLRTFKHEEGTIPLLASRGLPALLAQPRWKAVLWQAWLEWTAR